MAQRSFPFTPTSATELEEGDLVAVLDPDAESWTCLQVLELGPRARKTFVVGLLPWRSTQPPSPSDVAGLAPLDRALTRIEIFTEGGLQVSGHAPPSDAGQERWHGPGYVGKRTRVLGWMAAIRHAQGVTLPQR